MINALKDRVTSQAARLHCNNLIARYGVVQELRIDSAQQRVEFVCLLEGETAPIAITIEKYAITAKDGEKYIHVEASRCSRLWVHHFLEDHVHGRTFPLPSWAAAVL